MPELDGVTIVAMASFAVLILAWLFAPTSNLAASEAELSAAA